MPDFTFESHFSIWLVQPRTPEASKHLAEHVSDEAQWFGTALAVEPRYVESLAIALEDAGFSVSL